MADVILWPVVPRPQPKALPQRIPIQSRERCHTVSAEDQQAEKRRQLELSHQTFSLELRKLMLIAQLHGEVPWAIRLVESSLAEAKTEFLTGDSNADSK